MICLNAIKQLQLCKAFYLYSKNGSKFRNTESTNMPRRKNNGSLNNCEFCSSVFETEWAKIGHLTNEHSDLNAIVTTMQTRDLNQYISEQY